jgi:hypothetical protein
LLKILGKAPKQEVPQNVQDTQEQVVNEDNTEQEVAVENDTSNSDNSENAAVTPSENNDENSGVSLTTSQNLNQSTVTLSSTRVQVQNPTGPREGENPQYDAIVRENSSEVVSGNQPTQTSNNEDTNNTRYDYDNDSMYQEMTNGLQTLENRLRSFEQQHNMTTRGALNQSASLAEFDSKTQYQRDLMRYNSLKNSMESYKKIMDNWQNGEKISFWNLSGVNFTNIECITLKDGKRAYKTDQGTFYPDYNGRIGKNKVPQELLE